MDTYLDELAPWEKRRDSLLYMFVCERYIASVKMERD